MRDSPHSTALGLHSGWARHGGHCLRAGARRRYCIVWRHVWGLRRLFVRRQSARGQDLYVGDTGQTQAVTTSNGTVNLKLWEAKLTLTDDRDPGPIANPAGDTVRALSGQSATVEVEDCGHNKVSFTFTAPAPSPSEQVSQPPPAPQQTAPEYVYQGYWSASYVEDPDAHTYICDPNTLELVFWSLQFNSDGTILLHHCQGNTDVNTDCYIAFQKDKSNPQLFESYQQARLMLSTFKATGRRVVLQFTSTKEGVASYCFEEFNQR